MRKFLTIIGARPQFIKASMLSKEIKNYSELNETIIHTGQHFDYNMSEVFFREMAIPVPAYNLNINNTSPGNMIGEMISGIERIIIKEKPDAVIVYGDTFSTLAGAIAASHSSVVLVHIEAGLRSYNNKMPEELNRVITDRVSNILFCPSVNAVENLKKEGLFSFTNHIYNSGDIMFDAALYFSNKRDKSIINKLDLRLNEYVLATIHRKENTDNFENLKKLVGLLNLLSKETDVIVPLHPRTTKQLEKFELNNLIQFRIISPVGYLDMLQLIQNCKLVMTDSGGLQKEAYFFNKYCITLRQETEWVELFIEGVNFVCGTDIKKIMSQYHEINPDNFPQNRNIYGDGNAAKIITRILNEFPY